MNGACEDIDYCKGIECDVGRRCINGLCLKVPNYCEIDGDCPEGFHCSDLKVCSINIVVDPCYSVPCGSDERCVNGVCKGLCEDHYCPEGTECR